jgi:hypothetical protein
MWLDVKFPLHPALAAGLTSWFPSFHSTVTTQWQTRDLTSCWQTPLPCTPLVLDLFPISAYGITMTHVFVNPNCYGVMPFIINFQHRISSKKLKKSNMLTKKLKKSNVLTKLPWRQGLSWRSCCCIWTHHLKEGTCVQTATQQDKTRLLESGGTFCRTWEEIGSS